MMQKRDKLSEIFHDICPNVYYSPPANIKMKYPCIIYELEDLLHYHANNKIYMGVDRYSITVIDQKPDSEIAKKVDGLPYCSLNRKYTADNLNHFAFTIFF